MKNNHFKDYIKYMQDGASYTDIKNKFDSLNAENDNYYASNDNKWAEMTGSNWESVTSEMDDLIPIVSQMNLTLRQFNRKVIQMTSSSPDQTSVATTRLLCREGSVFGLSYS